MRLRRLLVLALAAVVVLAVALPAFAGGSAAVRLPGNVPGWVAGAQVAGPADTSQTVDFSLWFTFRNEGNLDAQLAHGSQNTAMSLQQFMASYGPSQTAYQSVENWLEAKGFSIVGTPENRLYVKAEGTIGQVEEAFDMDVNQYDYHGHKWRSNAQNPAVPSRFAGVVDAITGLNTAGVYQPAGQLKAWQPNAEQPKEISSIGDSVPCGVVGQTDNCYYFPGQIRKAYGLDQVPYDGSGETIVIIDAYGSTTAAQDLADFDTFFGLPSADLTVIQTGAAHTPAKNPHYANQQGWAGEIGLDLQWSHVMAPGAKLVLLASPNAQRDLDEAVNRAVVHHLGDIISLSWGLPEFAVSRATTNAQERIYKEAAAQGISVQVSSGDDGDEFSTYGIISADYPAASPYVTAVGGTSLFLNADDSYGFETSWGTTLNTKPKGSDTWTGPEFYYGGGGGYSHIFSQPSWQTVDPSITGGMRGVPDISMDADPYTGVPVASAGALGIWGGTSLAAPLFSGVMAVADQAAGHRLGQAAPLLYGMQGTNAIRDVQPRDTSNLFIQYVGAVSGNTYRIGFGSDSSLTVTPGWDDATGLGSIWVPGLLQQLGD